MKRFRGFVKKEFYHIFRDQRVSAAGERDTRRNTSGRGRNTILSRCRIRTDIRSGRQQRIRNRQQNLRVRRQGRHTWPRDHRHKTEEPIEECYRSEGKVPSESETEIKTTTNYLGGKENV